MAKRKEKTQNQIDIEKYEQEIAYWQERYDKANDAHDWSERNLCSCRIKQKTEMLEWLKGKCKKRDL